jgi:ankyrin
MLTFECASCLFYLQNGQTALSIAQQLGYISVVEILKGVTEVTATMTPGEEKYKVVSPEIMQETFMTDSEDEGGRWHHPKSINVVNLEIFLKYFCNIIF